MSRYIGKLYHPVNKYPVEIFEGWSWPWFFCVQRSSRRADPFSAAAMSLLAGFDLTPLRLLVMLLLLSAVSGVGH